MDKATGLRCDQSIRLSVAKSPKNYPDKIWRIKYYGCNKDIRLVFLTHDFEMGATEIATVYKSRWQIEVFFQVDQAGPSDKNTLGTFAQRGKNTIVDRDKYLSDGGIFEVPDKKYVLHLRNDTSSGNSGFC